MFIAKDFYFQFPRKLSWTKENTEARPSSCSMWSCLKCRPSETGFLLSTYETTCSLKTFCLILGLMRRILYSDRDIWTQVLQGHQICRVLECIVWLETDGDHEKGVGESKVNEGSSLLLFAGPNTGLIEQCGSGHVCNH